MLNLLSLSDFDSIYTIPTTGFNDSDVLKFINNEEYNILIDLFGDEIYNDFEANLTEQKYIDLLNGRTYTNCFSGLIKNYLGLKKLLVPLIYSRFVIENQKRLSVTGLLQNDNENSAVVSNTDLLIKSYSAQNEGVRYYNEAFNYLYSNLNDFQGFECYHKKYVPKAFYQSYTAN